MPSDRRVLLIISGGIAAYKTPELVRQLRHYGMAVRCVLTAAARHFVAPLSLAAVSEDRVYEDLLSLTDEHEMGHIELSRQADLVLVAPATANILAAMATGLANDLATTLLLATDKPVVVAPAMNVRMWQHPATQANMATLAARGITCLGPEEGEMACGEYGPGRMREPEDIAAAIAERLGAADVLRGRRVLVTSGPTHEPIDPVRYIANRSSGKQGHAIAAAVARLGAETVLVSGPTDLAAPAGVRLIAVETAQQMHDACLAALPVDVAVCAAAVADWRVVQPAEHKLKKTNDDPPTLNLAPNPDILRTLAEAEATRRPRLVVGFAAETESLVEHATAKRQAKGCDWIVANDVSAASGVFGGEHNHVVVIDENGSEAWPQLSKAEVAERLARRIATALAATTAGAPSR